MTISRYFEFKMIAFILLFELFAAIVSAEDKNTTLPEVSKHIYYGQLVRIEEFPFFAGLDGCGAVILSEIWILTAAHCIADVRIRELQNVRVGGTTREDSIVVPHDDVIVHHGYKELFGNPTDDIALIKLTTPLKFSSKVQPVKLPNGKPTSRDFVLVGKGQDEAGENPKYLEKVDLIELPMRDCIFTAVPKEYHLFVKQNMEAFERSHICTTRPVDLPSACYGDSGSPLVRDGTLFGLASYNEQKKGEKLKCDKYRLAFFTNVYTYLTWIRQHTGL